MADLHSYDEDEVSFFYIDQHAEKASLPFGYTLADVVQYLSAGIPEDETKHQQLLLARACVIWLKNVATQLRTSIFPVIPLTLLEEGPTICSMYKCVCREAGIECEVVTGRAKDAEYRTGATDITTLQEYMWNSIKCDGTWHLVHTSWCFSSVVGYEQGDAVNLESDGEAKLESLAHNPGTVVSQFDGVWFCVNPKLFVTRCLPDDLNWQLTKEEPISEEQFLNLPDYGDGFFMGNMTLLSKYACSQESQNGKCIIAFLVDKNRLNSLDFHYKLKLLEGDASQLNKDEIPLLVRSKEHMDGTKEYEVHFPVVGTYSFDLSVRFVDENYGGMYGCLHTKIICSEINPSVMLSPVETGIEGWGYGQCAQDAGLEKPSKTDPTVVVKPPSEEDDAQTHETFKFRLDEDMMNIMEYKTEMYSNQQLVPGMTETRVDTKRCQLEIKARVDNEGEYALVVKAGQKGREHTSEPVLNYLLTTHDDTEDREMKKQMKQKKLEVMHEAKRTERTKVKKRLQTFTEKLRKEIESLRALLPPELQAEFDINVDVESNASGDESDVDSTTDDAHEQSDGEQTHVEASNTDVTGNETNLPDTTHEEHSKESRTKTTGNKELGCNSIAVVPEPATTVRDEEKEQTEMQPGYGKTTKADNTENDEDVHTNGEQDTKETNGSFPDNQEHFDASKQEADEHTDPVDDEDIRKDTKNAFLNKNPLSAVNEDSVTEEKDSPHTTTSLELGCTAVPIPASDNQSESATGEGSSKVTPQTTASLESGGTAVPVPVPNNQSETATGEGDRKVTPHTTTSLESGSTAVPVRASKKGNKAPSSARRLSSAHNQPESGSKSCSIL